MAATTVTLSRPPRRTLRRVLVALLLVVVAAALGLGAYLYQVARSALPQLDGTLHIAGLSAPVTVIRDEHGVPAIEAANLEDLFFAQGYVTAQDRLWQMDLLRRYAAGELSEVLGEDLVKHDRQQRILGLRSVAHLSLGQASARDRAFLEAYARGVNAFIASSNGRLPIEFRILRYTPKAWTTEDSILLGANLIENLNHGVYEQALQHEKILALLPPELASDLAINSSWHDRPPTQGPPRLDEPETDSPSSSLQDISVSQSRAPLSGLTEAADTDRFWPGSNNWVVSGSHTVSGKPLLSNDMHLQHQMPNLWYEAHLHSGNFDVAGVTLPGLPFVIVGHNQRIGWGFTNVGPTVQDLYVETFNSQGQYLTPQGWRAADHRVETIHVKHRPDVTLDVVLTRHGPIINELVPGEKSPLALRWTLFDGLHDPFFDIDSAQNWHDFLAALATWDSPSQNAVYADVDGHIGYHATGHIPIRKAGDGSIPASGQDDSHEWTGYIPFEKLPSVSDPSWGVIATANARITPDRYAYPVSNQWDPSWRTERIYRVLEAGKKLAPADMLALQTDVYSAFDRFCAERFVYALDHAPNLSARARQARDLLRDWDGRMTTDSAAPTLVVRARRQVWTMLLEPKLKAGHDAKPDAAEMTPADLHWSMSSVLLENVLLKQPRRWLPENFASYDALLVAAMERVLSSSEIPPNLADWTWGKTFKLEIQHPILGRIPLLKRWTGPGVVSQAGGGLTVKQSGPRFGPSERLTVDFSNLDQTTLNVVTGQGGNFLSPYYMDQWKAWYEGTSFALPFSAAAVEKTKAHKLTLEPAKAAGP